MNYLKNIDQLLCHGEVEARKLALDIVEYALQKADPAKALDSLVSIDKNIMRVGSDLFDLNNYRRVFLFGAGKASFPIAKFLEQLLGEKISDGVIVSKYGQEGTLRYSRLYHANHPIPNQAGYEAAKSMIELASKAESNDLVLTCFTGGSSALLPYPVKEISLDDKILANSLLLKSGANIVEINAVRKHLSDIKGGMLVKKIDPQVPIINFTVSDVIGDPLDYITCPTVPDTSTFKDARATLSKYKLWDKVPPSVKNYLQQATEEHETPKHFQGRKIFSHILVPSGVIAESAVEKGTSLGLNCMLLSTMLEGESKEVGIFFASIIKEIIHNQRPLEPPCLIVSGGETTVRINNTNISNLGGPNQEFVLGAVSGIDGLPGSIALIGLDTDGTDGPTDYAGGIVDNFTMSRLRKLNLNHFTALEEHKASNVLSELGDLLITGQTGTNVNDLKLVVVLPK